MEHLNLRCVICSENVPADRATKKGYAAVTCSVEHYAEFRRRKKRPTKGYRVTKEEIRRCDAYKTCGS